jgi:pimeloyl-ACP methyl ester carboxylesterase
MRHNDICGVIRERDSVSDVLAPDGVRIRYVADGVGYPVVLLHGISADAEMNWEWTGIAPALRRAGFRTVAIDQRGHGRSDKPYDIAAYADDRFAADVSAVLDHTSIEECALVGYSMGAFMALRTAPREPRVSKLVLGGIGDTAPEPWEREAVALALEVDELGDLPAGEARSIREYADATGADRQALAAIQRGRTDAPFDFDAITIPTLVVVGEDDELAGDAAELADALADARFVTVPGDHASALIEPALVDAIISFLL